MNKIYKVIYSKVRQCYVVVSEIAKSHGRHTHSSVAKTSSALTAAVLIALGSLSITATYMPTTAEAVTKTRTDGSNYIGVERRDGLNEEKDFVNYGGKGANGDNSITLGLKAQAGSGTITIGDRNSGASLASVYVGQGDVAKPKLDTGGWATSIGYNSDATGYGSIALGSNAVAKNSYAKDSKGNNLVYNQTYVEDGETKVRLVSKPDIQRASVAIGYGASADNGNIAIGSYSDASTDLRTATTTDGKEITSYLTDTKADSYVSVGKSDALRRISNVADGAADTDAATIAQLKKAVEATDASKKANIDATNIGKNLKYKADGKTAAESSDIKTNEDAWGTAIGTGEVADKNGQLVTGGTVFSALQQQTDNLKPNAGWGINVADETDENGNVTKKNVISLNRNLGTNYGNRYGTGKVTFEADGENSLILGGGAGNHSFDEKDKDVTYGAHAKDSVLLGGWNNDIGKDSERAVIIGGAWNSASSSIDSSTGKAKVQETGTDAIIVGGFKNTAKGDGAVLMGGQLNEATGLYSTTIGGSNNKNAGSESAIVGGVENEITTYGQGNSIFGGGGNKITFGAGASILGGYENTADMKYATVVGGGVNKSSGVLSSVFGGANNLSNANASTVVGGQLNGAIGAGSVVSGGGANLASGGFSYASGGRYNHVTGDLSSSLGGMNSSVNGMYSTGVAGGSTGKDAMLSLAAGYQSVVADSGIEKTDLSEDNPEDADELNKYSEALEAYGEGDKSKMESLSGYYELDPDSSMGHAKVTHYDKFSTALGYQATADEPGTIAFGHDAGDESGYTYEWETLTDENGNPKQNEIDGTTNDYTKAPKSVKKKAPYTSAYYNRLVKVADGIDDHDVVVMEQLKQYAEKDASNIGNNIKVYKTDANGNVQLDKDKKPIEETDATTTAQNGSKDAWGKALGAGTFTTGTDTTPTNASISDQLVTGKTLYDYDKPTGTQNYVKANNTTGQNLSALDAQVAANTSTLNDKTHNIKYYSVDETILPKINGYSNEDNDGAKGMGSIAAGFNTHADGIASTVAGSYSGVSNQNSAGLYDLRGATALSYGTFNINQNKDTGKIFSGVANSIIGQANATIDSNAAIIYGAGNTVINSYRAIDTSNTSDTSDTSDTSKFLSKVKQDIKNKDAAAVAKDLQKAVPTSGGQVMVMGGGNNVESAYMTQVVGVGNTVKGNQVQNTKNEWVTDTSDTAIKDYDAETSSQYNYVDGFNNEVINGKHDYVIGANNKLSGDSYDNDTVRPIKRSNRSNIVIGDNHTLTREQNTVIIGSSDTENTQTKARDAVIIGHNANATNDTGADNAVAIGRSATATGGNAVTIGINTSAGENSITIGSESHASSGSNIAIGKSVQVYGYNVTNAVALGENTKALVSDGVAIGSESQATVKGNSAEGYDPVTGKDSTDETATWKATKAAVSIGKADGTVTRQINGLAAGTNDTDAVNVAQLKKLEGMKANVDATNIGKNLKGTDGNTASAEDITANEKAWGAALGTGDIATPKDMLVTDKAIHDELRPTTDGTYVKGSQTTAENLSKLDAQVKTNADGISTNTTNITKNAGDITKLKNLSNITNEGRTVIKNLSKDAVKVAAGDRISVAENVDSATGNKTYTVSAKNDGQVAAGDQNLVSGDTVNTAINNAITNAGTATDTKLAGKANVDASNIGENMKDANGNKASDTEINKNKESWASAIGTNTVAKDNKQLVTSDAVATALEKKADKTYVDQELNKKADKTYVDEQLDTKANKSDVYTKDQTYSKSEVDSKVSDITTGLDGKAGKDLDNISDKGQQVIHNIAKDAVEVVDGTNTTVTKTEGTNTTPTKYAVNVEGKGKVASGDTGLISGDTLYKEVHVDTDGSYIKGSQTVGQNLSNLDTGLKTTSDLIHTNAKGDAIQIGGNSTATKVDISGKDSNGNTTGRVITGVVSDVSDPNSAANIGYVNGITSASNEQIYHDMNMQYNHVENDISRAAAGSNALAALHPMQEFDPDDKAQFALGYGHYRNSNAGAVGAFYQPDENSMVNFGVSFGNGEAGINAGVTFKFGPGGSGHHALTKTQMAKVIDAQSKEIDELKKDNADKDKRIDALEQKMTEILAKLDKSKD